MSTDTAPKPTTRDDDDQPASKFDRIGQRLADDRELTRTLVYAGIGLSMLILALVVNYAITPPTLADYDDVGEPFYPEFDDALQAAGIRVAAWNPTASRVDTFEVKRTADGFVIPSHSDYPADSGSQLADAATSLIGVKRDARLTGDEKAFEQYELIDPLDTKYLKLDGRGKRVTLTDRAGETLADYIVGKQADNGRYYVRRPDEDRVYLAELSVDVSTRFEDWVQSDLLDLDENKVVEIIVENNKLDEQTGRVMPTDAVELTREQSSDDWQLAGLPDDQTLKTDLVDNMVTALSDLDLIGVRRKSAGIAALLAGEGNGRISRNDERDLRRRGFYITRDGVLVSLEGTMSIGQVDGVNYVLQFGRSFTGSALDIEVGSEDESSSEADSAESGSDDESGDEVLRGRYVFIQPVFDESLIPNPEPPEEPAEDADEATRNAYKLAKTEAEQAAARRRLAIVDGEKRTEELARRFADWYYVIPAEVFDTLVVSRSELIETPEAADGAADGTESSGAASGDAPAPPQETPPQDGRSDAASDAAMKAVEELAGEAAASQASEEDPLPVLPNSVSDQLRDFVDEAAGSTEAAE